MSGNEIIQGRRGGAVAGVIAMGRRIVARFDPPESAAAMLALDTADGVVRVRRPILLHGWLLAAFVAAVPAPLLVVAALAGEQGGLARDPAAASGWPAATVTFAAFVYFATRRAPAELERFRERNALPDAAGYTSAIGMMERRAENRLAWAFAVILAAIVEFGYVVALGDVGRFPREGIREGGGWQTAEMLEVTLGPLLAALAALGFWRMATLGWVVNHLGSLKLRIRLGHPDRCGGLEPLGRICVWNALILAVPGALLGFWLVAAQLGYGDTNPVVHGLLELIVIAVGMIALFLPLRRIKAQMEAAAVPVNAARQAVAAGIDEMTQRLLTDAALSPRKRSRLARRLAREKRHFQNYEGLPTWPIRSGDVARFAAVNVPAVLGVISTAVSLLRSAVEMVNPAIGS